MNEENPELQLAEEYVQHTACNVFLTGKAGTGKTTFLQTLRQQTGKRLVVTAPTGVAAINAGGVTLHSFFQLPFGPFAPGTDPLAREKHRLSREKRNIIASLDLLIIDEISMVRADLLDLVDTVLRRYRRSDRPFGGVQLLMIGDLHQLPPVVKDTDWQILKPHYDSPYFFSSTALRRAELVVIELKRIYRQTDPAFIGLLNRVRDNTVDAHTLKELNSRYVPDFAPDEKEGYITLSTHNSSAEAINSAKLKELQGTSRSFQAELSGDFPDHIYPTADTLELKVGAQVMFVKNDQSAEKRYFNGKIGTVIRMSNSSIEIRCPQDVETIEVGRATWENIEYSVDPDTAEISQKTIGTFGQYPLKLAWAITIHKSQGLTFDKAVIDAQAAFAHGQVYVALSRCRTFSGLVLSSPLTQAAVRTDPTVSRFAREAEHNGPNREKLDQAKIHYQRELLLDCFSFQKLGSQLGRLVSLLNRNSTLIQLAGAGDLGEIQKRTVAEICSVGENFRRQLHSLFSDSALPGEDPTVLARLAKASVYFQDKFAEVLQPTVEAIQVDTDNKEIRKQLDKAIAGLREEVAEKLAAVKACRNGFSPASYLRALSAAALEIAKPVPKPVAATYSEADVGHPELFTRLKDWRRQKAVEKGVQLFQIMHQKTLVQIAVHLPDSIMTLKNIQGIGPKMVANYGAELVQLVREYREEYGIVTVELPALPLLQMAAAEEKEQKPARGDTKNETLELFRQGKTVPEIAAARQLTTATIEKHLVHFVESGEVDIRALVSDSDRQRIESAIAALDGASLKEMRNAAGLEFSYGEIQFVLAQLKRKD